ncbi:MAG: response regulator [Alphaproteobacteria bacterium PRO2]|nr:response regulator [Alphaproteobacteria bacterium PRO2]
MPYSLDRVKILIVDDMVPMLSLVKSVLSIYGFKEIFTANDGEEAFELVCRHDPDLIITDWVMEPMDGLEFTKKVRRSPLSPNPYVPILMMTGFSSRIRVESSRDTGITEFLVKPFNSRDLCARIVQIVEKPRQFVDAVEFFGPDRRRRDDRDYEGTRKRGDDATRGKSDDKTTDILKKLREEAKTIS